mmetsp:Transcript_26486/g.84815  ORF Transcript_26486/g.84815 Transcript_26486/m.84815 type:complete len:233 (+) Transcript_26486:112-810(+)
MASSTLPECLSRRRLLSSSSSKPISFISDWPRADDGSASPAPPPEGVEGAALGRKSLAASATASSSSLSLSLSEASTRSGTLDRLATLATRSGTMSTSSGAAAGPQQLLGSPLPPSQQPSGSQQISSSHESSSSATGEGAVLGGHGAGAAAGPQQLLGSPLPPSQQPSGSQQISSSHESSSSATVSASLTGVTGGGVLSSREDPGADAGSTTLIIAHTRWPNLAPVGSTARR